MFEAEELGLSGEVDNDDAVSDRPGLDNDGGEHPERPEFSPDIVQRKSEESACKVQSDCRDAETQVK